MKRFIKYKYPSGAHMDQHTNREERLWDYIDGLSSEKEKAAIDILLREDQAWQKTYQELLEIHSVFRATPLEEPSMRFSKNVMDEIARHKIAPATSTYVNKKIIYGIGGFFLLVIGGFLVYLFTQIDYSQPVQSKLMNRLPDMNVNWQQYVNTNFVNVFLIVDAVLGLFYLDYFLRKKKEKETAVKLR
jgi:general stress protein CsbA